MERRVIMCEEYGRESCKIKKNSWMEIKNLTKKMLQKLKIY